ncbi:extracellular solute-binding protein [Halothermothrix orenii]|uniref:Extracellular solute-binding protein family 1 n=1 Tax=Halothermothrix orenii (strain H 168 / OCM 544 / DSM 9562) TaxID=373903 RepID=B8CXP5_HALOH|nr:extracellular solute-binding protein [Halothermothrix orenii]ACL70064.1 extracellular solute-binding protein family 1 [Halothermothrix orenii H 168]
MRQNSNFLFTVVFSLLLVGMLLIFNFEMALAYNSPVELTFWNIWVGPNPDYKVMISRVEEFNKSHSDINIKMQRIPHDQYKTKIKIQAAGGQLPDLIQTWPGEELRPLVEGGTLMPIDEIVGYWKNNLIPASQFKDYSIDGRVYAIPGNIVYTHTIYYNKDLLKSVGYNEFPGTYNEFKVLIKKLRGNNIIPIALGNKGKWVLQSCFLSTIGDRVAGEEFLTKVMEGKKKFTDPEFIKSLKVIKELSDIKAFNLDANSLNNIQQRQYFYQGKAAMYVEGTWALGDVINKAKNIDVGVATFPEIEGEKAPKSLSGVSGYGISLNANLSKKEKEAAFQFLKYFYSEKLYKGFLKVGTFVPAKVTVTDVDPLMKKEMELVQKYHIAPVYDAVLPVDITNVLNNGLQSLIAGMITPEKLAKELQKSLD